MMRERKRDREREPWGRGVCVCFGTYLHSRCLVGGGDSRFLSHSHLVQPAGVGRRYLTV